jgi:hypothetical protein
VIPFEDISGHCPQTVGSIAEDGQGLAGFQDQLFSMLSALVKT